MRLANQLNQEELLEIVESIQGFLYLDLDDDGSEVWNPDKPCSGADTVDHIMHVLDGHELVPQTTMPYESSPSSTEA